MAVQEWIRGSGSTDVALHDRPRGFENQDRAGFLDSVHAGGLNLFLDVGFVHGFEPKHVRRFFRQVTLLPDGCWLWTGATCRNNYPRFSAACRSFPAYRWAYELFISEVPAGLEIDHLCRMRECVNPWHLQPVTHAENMRRSSVAYRADPSKFLHRLWDRSHLSPPRVAVKVTA